MDADAYPLHQRSEVDVDASATSLFARLDDHRRLASHMEVTERTVPWRKTWETRGEPRLLVIGAYRMGFTIAPREARSHLVVFIDYRLPQRGFARVLGLLFGRAYAAWCTRWMSTDAATTIVAVTAS